MNKKKGTSHSSQLKRLSRIEGQVRGIGNMIESQRYCIDILTQIKAIKAAISKVEKQIVDDHLTHCVHTAIASKNSTESQKMLDEIRDLLGSL